MPRLQTEIELPDRYLHARHLASGGMAAVFAAEDSVLGRPVAVKVLAERFLSDTRAVRRFQREARAAAKASQHPHVVTIYDVGEHDGRPFIVMELMPGGSLEKVLADGPPTRADTLRWIREAASALDHAHAQGVIHRDVKPGNLLLDERGRLGVADFGIARLAFESSLTQTGQLLGTRDYLAPEQIRGQEASAASDRYALAVVAHELLTGRKPGAERPGVPPPLERALQRGLAADPEARWPTCTAFADALNAEPDTAPTRAFARPRPAPILAEPAAAARRWRAPLLAVAAIAAFLVAVVLAVALSGGDKRAAPGTATSPPRSTTSPRPPVQASLPTPLPPKTVPAPPPKTVVETVAVPGTDEHARKEADKQAREEAKKLREQAKKDRQQRGHGKDEGD